MDPDNARRVSFRNPFLRASREPQAFSAPVSRDQRASSEFIAASGYTTTIIWEISSGTVIARMNHDDYTHSVAFSPDGKRIVTGSADKTARLWDALTGREIARVLHDGMVWIVGFSPDNKYVVSGSDDGTTNMWIWQPEDLILDACSRITRNLSREEWQQYIGDSLPYEAVCSNLPIEPEPTLTP